MKTLQRKLQNLIKDRAMMKRILFILGALIVFRLMAAIPVPGVDPAQLQAFLSSNQFFGLLNIFAGGGLSQLSIIMIGVGAYITSSIIMQLLTVMVPRLKTLYHEEGEIGRKKFMQYSRLLTVPIAFLQGFSLLVLLNQQGILADLSPLSLITNLFVIVGGAVLIMWIGELMSEFGIGNGVSLLIFAGIVAILPAQVSQLLFTYTPDQLPLYIAFLAVAALVIAGVVLVTEAERTVPITYAKQSRGGETYGGAATYLPLRINMAGVMPLIFALSILLFPQMIAGFLVNSSNVTMQTIAQTVLSVLENGWIYSIIYFVLVFVFTYFYTAITFDPESIATNLQKNGAFIPGVRPGEATADYIAKVVSRTTFIGAIFLGLIAVLPIALQSATGVQSFAIGGTALLIVVAVLLDLLKRVDAQLAMREY